MRRLLLAFVFAWLAGPALAAGLAVGDAASPAAFPLVAAGAPAAIYVDAQDWPGVVRAASDLQADLQKVSGANVRLTSTEPPRKGPVVIVGTLGRSAVIDRLARDGRLDVAGVRGQWEAFVQQVVDRPLPGVDRALVIAGADKRGTIFGVYDLSARMGVSPWTWWADVPVTRRAEVYVTGREVQKPTVRYRGIFLNDEDPALLGWANQAFGGFNHRFYGRVFELILRLKGNYLWPAMWGKAFADDDPLNPRLADEMGVVIGTSHHEPMMRAHVEWERYGQGPWDYTANAPRLQQFWREGMVRRGSTESLVTIGMRGDGDAPMTQGTAVALLERIVADQRKIIGETTGEDPALTPQVWALYKEVQDYYDQGMRVPSDVTLLFSDDNWGNIRRLPKPGQVQGGGFGVYYHFDYVGGPRNYKWLNTNQIERTWEQMRLAHAYGADRLWIVNVGDLKPMEFPTSFFLDLAWDPDAMTLARLADYPRAWATQQFGPAQASEIGELLTRYTLYNARRKPELIDPATFSQINFREAERVVAAWDALEARAEALRGRLRPDQQDAYFQLVLFPVEASANLTRLYVAAGRNRLYADQGRAATNDEAAAVQAYFARDRALTAAYHSLAGGKWDHMMSQTHIGYTGWQQPPVDAPPAVRTLSLPAAGALGVAVEEDGQPLSRYGAPARRIEVFNRGAGPLRFTATADVPWLRLSRTSDEVGEQTTLEVGVDWALAPPGAARARVSIAGSDGTVRAVDLVAEKLPGRPHGFVEADGRVTIEAEHYARAVGRWQTIPNLGRTLSGVEALPLAGPAISPGGASARLEYPIHLASTGEVEVQVTLAPTLDFKGQGGLRYAVSLDGAPPQVVNVHAGDTDAVWARTVADNARISISRHRVARAGPHVLKLWQVDPGLVFERVVVAARPVPESYLGPPESRKVAGP